MPSRVPKTLFTFNSKEEIDDFATGCDADIGGTSTVNLTFNSQPSHEDSIARLVGSQYKSRPTAKFWGEMRLAVRPDLRDEIRGGYAGFRSKARRELLCP